VLLVLRCGGYASGLLFPVVLRYTNLPFHPQQETDPTKLASHLGAILIESQKNRAIISYITLDFCLGIHSFN
jgi:hypothetical protein